MTAAASNETKGRARKGAAGSLRKRILDAALGIIATDGLKRLTQPKVAAAAGIRQSHLTYYFPKKVDLIVALLDDHVHGDGRHDRHDAKDVGPGLDVVASDRKRISFFLNLVVEAEQEPSLRRMVYEHMTAFDAVVARAYGREVGDPDVEAFVDALRGFGMKQVLLDRPRKIDIDALANRLGLRKRDRKRNPSSQGIRP